MAMVVARRALPAETSTEPRLVIRLYDSTGASRENLAVAGEELIRILVSAGVDAAWLDCSGYRLERPEETACSRAGGPLDIVFTILRHPEAGSALSEETLAFSAVPNDGSPGVFAGVFLDRVGLVGRAARTWKFRTVGLLAAHEIGHLLLGPNSHSRGGIMRPELSETTLQGTAWKHLCFSPSEAERMRAELRSRLEAANRR